MTLKQSPWHDYRHGDSEVFRYMGTVIWNGGVPYRDAFDHKPPLIYFLAALTHPIEPWGLWFWDLILLICSGILLCRLLLFLKTPCPLLVVILWMLLQETNDFVQSGGNTRSMSALLIVIIFSIIFRTRRISDNILIGVCIGSVFWLQQNEVIGISTVVFLTLLRCTRSFLQSFILISIGFLAISLPILAYFTFHQASNDLFRDAFFFNFEYYMPEISFSQRLTMAWRGLVSTKLIYPITLSSVALCLAVLTRIRMISSTYLIAWLGLIVQIVFGVTASGRGYGHYYQTVIPFIIICFSLSLNAVMTISLPWFRYLSLGGFVVATLASWPSDSPRDFWKESLYALRHAASPIFHEATDQKLAGHLREIRKQRGQLFVMRSLRSIGLYTDYDVIAPTRVIYSHFWDQYPSLDYQGTYVKDVCRGMDLWETKYLIDYSAVDPLPILLQKQWTMYINENYVKITKNRDHSDLWIRNKYYNDQIGP